jgi:signal transduction histidine kinase
MWTFAEPELAAVSKICYVQRQGRVSTLRESRIPGKALGLVHEETTDFHIFSVSDNGKALKEADSEKIFGLFQRHETSRGVEGAGLGLTIHQSAAAHPAFSQEPLGIV